MTARLLMIGIDGADGPQLDRYSADGTLPHLTALRTRGAAHRLSPPPGNGDDAVWASFNYGVGLGEHGRYHYVLPRSDGRLGEAHLEEAERRTFWEDLSDAGHRVAVLDVPKCREPRAINGIHLADWSVHGRYFPQPRSQPPSLAAEVVERFGPMAASKCSHLHPALDDDSAAGIARNLRASVAQKLATGLHYLGSGPWDLFIVAFKEAHCASHSFWDLDPSHPSYDAGRRERLGAPLIDVLHDIDAAVGALVAAAGPDAEVVVFSTSDYEANASLDHLMPGIVKRLNAVGSAGGPFGRVFPRWCCTVLPYNENWSALRVTGGSGVRLRRNDGRADAGYLNAIAAELHDLRDADTGARVVASITRPSAELEGARAASLPDLLVQCVAGSFPRAVVSPKLGRIEATSQPMRPGNHVAGGFVIAAGKRATGLSDDVRTTADVSALARAVLADDQREPGASSRRTPEPIT